MKGRPGRIIPAIVLASVSLSGCSRTSAPPESADQAKASVPGQASAPDQPVNADAKAVAGPINAPVSGAIRKSGQADGKEHA